MAASVALAVGGARAGGKGGSSWWRTARAAARTPFLAAAQVIWKGRGAVRGIDGGSASKGEERLLCASVDGGAGVGASVDAGDASAEG